MRSCLALYRKPVISLRSISLQSEGKFTTVEVDDKSGVAVLTMNRPPVNGLNLELLHDIRCSIGQIESNKCRGLILTSSCSNIFSAGLDILEMYKPEQERLKQFWTALQDAWLALYGSNVPTAAAINGHSPAGGCLLAASCEYRVMLPKFSIGLNETKLGIVAPEWFMASICNVIPRRVAEMALTQGKMFSSEEAFKVGLVDELAETKEEALVKCEQFLSTFAKISPPARALTKKKFRSKDLQQLINEKAQDLESFINFANQPNVQKGLGLYLESLKKKS